MLKIEIKYYLALDLLTFFMDRISIGIHLNTGRIADQNKEKRESLFLVLKNCWLGFRGKCMVEGIPQFGHSTYEVKIQSGGSRCAELDFVLMWWP